jgi:hypothetical protein
MEEGNKIMKERKKRKEKEKEREREKYMEEGNKIMKERKKRKEKEKERERERDRAIEKEGAKVSDTISTFRLPNIEKFYERFLRFEGAIMIK